MYEVTLPTENLYQDIHKFVSFQIQEQLVFYLKLNHIFSKNKNQEPSNKRNVTRTFLPSHHPNLQFLEIYSQHLRSFECNVIDFTIFLRKESINIPMLESTVPTNIFVNFQV